jgi:hypothetical protein
MATAPTHTTLRTLFVTTAVCALLAAIWAARTDPFLRILLTPCATVFVAGLFGFSIIPAFVIGLGSCFAPDAYYLLHRYDIELSIRVAGERALIRMLTLGLSWLTAWWWGIYLRYAWSMRLCDLETTLGTDEVPRILTLRERMLLRCSYAPVGFFIVTLLASVWVFLIAILLH